MEVVVAVMVVVVVAVSSSWRWSSLWWWSSSCGRCRHPRRPRRRRSCLRLIAALPLVGPVFRITASRAGFPMEVCVPRIKVEARRFF